MSESHAYNKMKYNRRRQWIKTVVILPRVDKAEQLLVDILPQIIE